VDPDQGVKAYQAVPVNGRLVPIALPPSPALSKFQRPAFGNGRYYVTGPGVVLAYGSPVALPLNCTSPMDFGEVLIGSSSTMTVTCNALISTRITSLTVGSPYYNATFANISKTVLAAGQTLTFPVTFNLKQYTPGNSNAGTNLTPGVKSGSITLNTVNGVTGYASIMPISITGQATSSSAVPNLNPLQVAFSPIVVGSASASLGSESTVVLANLGKTAMRIIGYAYTTENPLEADAEDFTNVTSSGGLSTLDSNGFFTSPALPPVGTSIESTSSLIIDLDFVCNVLGDHFTFLVVWTDGGMVFTMLTGSAHSSPIANVYYSMNGDDWTQVPDSIDTSAETVTNIDFGIYTGPANKEIIIKVENVGGSDLIITKSKPPVGSILGAVNPDGDLFEGLTISPGQSSTGSVFFQPGFVQLNSDPVYYSNPWTLNLNDLTWGVHALNFTAELVGAQVGPVKADGTRRFKWLGCYKDSTNSRIEAASTASTNNSNGYCQQVAVNQKAVFAAVEYMDECWYGRNIPSASLLASDANCQGGYLCTGDPTQVCGGVGGYAGIWYDTTGYFPQNNSLAPNFLPPSNKASVNGYTYAGCIADATNSRALSTGKGASSTRTVEDCSVLCTGYAYFGVEYGTECYCGNSIGSSGVTMPASGCNMACGGNPLELCGGSSRLSLYALNGTGVPSASSTTSQSSTTAASTTSTAAPTATSVPLSCPASNATIYTSANNESFLLECYIDHYGGDLSMVLASTYQQCCEACSTTTSCIAFSWIPGDSSPCYMKSVLGEGQVNNLVWGARMTSSSTSTSATTSSSSTTSSYTSSASSQSSTTTSTSTSSATAAATSLSCPTSNATYYVTNGQTFILECYVDHSAGDLSMVRVSSYAACADSCANTASCVAFSWQPGINNPCYMKKAVGAGLTNNGIWGGQVAHLTTSTSSTSTYASSSSTSTSTSSSSSSSMTSVASSSSTSSSMSTSTSTTSSSSSSTMSTSTSTSTTSTSSSTSSTSSSTSSTSSSTSSSSTISTTTSTTSSTSSHTSSSTSSTSSSVTPPTSTSSTSTSTSTTSSATSSSVPSTTPDWAYIGCANESTTSVRALSGTTSLRASNMTVEMCQAYCSSKKLPLAGVEYKTECYCGITLGQGSTLGQTGCNLPCGGDGSEICGGMSRLSVYRNSTFPVPRVVQSVGSLTLRGCFIDSSNARVLSGYAYSSSTGMSVETCAGTCMGKGYTVAGVEYGTQCYCGNSIPGSSSLAAESDCLAMLCPGDLSEYCAAGSRILVYA